MRPARVIHFNLEFSSIMASYVGSCYNDLVTAEARRGEMKGEKDGTGSQATMSRFDRASALIGLCRQIPSRYLFLFNLHELPSESYIVSWLHPRKLEEPRRWIYWCQRGERGKDKKKVVVRSRRTRLPVS